MGRQTLVNKTLGLMDISKPFSGKAASLRCGPDETWSEGCNLAAHSRRQTPDDVKARLDLFLTVLCLAENNFGCGQRVA